jgi:hypothetical protein
MVHQTTHYKTPSDTHTHTPQGGQHKGDTLKNFPKTRPMPPTQHRRWRRPLLRQMSQPLLSLLIWKSSHVTSNFTSPQPTQLLCNSYALAPPNSDGLRSLKGPTHNRCTCNFNQWACCHHEKPGKVRKTTFDTWEEALWKCNTIPCDWVNFREVLVGRRVPCPT